MIINPLALATKGYVGNQLNLTIASKGVIDLQLVTGKRTPNVYDRNRAMRRVRFR